LSAKELYDTPVNFAGVEPSLKKKEKKKGLGGGKKEKKKRKGRERI
jgi:hypothetical protein